MKNFSFNTPGKQTIDRIFFDYNYLQKTARAYSNELEIEVIDDRITEKNDEIIANSKKENDSTIVEKKTSLEKTITEEKESTTLNSDK